MVAQGLHKIFIKVTNPACLNDFVASVHNVAWTVTTDVQEIQKMSTFTEMFPKMLHMILVVIYYLVNHGATKFISGVFEIHNPCNSQRLLRVEHQLKVI